jgi:hypothetical protein
MKHLAFLNVVCATVWAINFIIVCIGGHPPQYVIAIGFAFATLYFVCTAYSQL